jgi:hypothetical protein
LAPAASLMALWSPGIFCFSSPVPVTWSVSIGQPGRR